MFNNNNYNINIKRGRIYYVYHCHNPHPQTAIRGERGEGEAEARGRGKNRHGGRTRPRGGRTPPPKLPGTPFRRLALRVGQRQTGEPRGLRITHHTPIKALFSRKGESSCALVTENNSATHGRCSFQFRRPIIRSLSSGRW